MFTESSRNRVPTLGQLSFQPCLSITNPCRWSAPFLRTAILQEAVLYPSRALWTASLPSCFFKKTPKYIESLHNNNHCLFEMYAQISVHLYYCMWLHITFSLSCSSLSLQQSLKVHVLGSYNFVTNHFQIPWLRTVFML